MANSSWNEATLTAVETLIANYYASADKKPTLSIDQENGGTTTFEDIDSLKNFHDYLYKFLNKNDDIDLEGSNKQNAYRPIHLKPYNTGNS